MFTKDLNHSLIVKKYKILENSLPKICNLQFMYKPTECWIHPNIFENEVADRNPLSYLRNLFFCARGSKIVNGSFSIVTGCSKYISPLMNEYPNIIITIITIITNIMDLMNIYI